MENRPEGVQTDLPQSSTSMTINLAGLFCFLFAVEGLRVQQYFDEVWASVVLILVLIVPIALLELVFLKTYRRSSTGLDFSLKNPFDLKRVLTRLLGLYVSLGFVAILYVVFPEYYDGFYDKYWRLLKVIVPVILIGSIPYFIVLDRYLVKPKEGYWQTGMMVLGNWEDLNRADLKNHFLGWLVKGFYLPIMFIFLTNDVTFLKVHSLMNELPFGSVENFKHFFTYMNNLIFTVDLAFVTLGYALTLRVLDNHMRSVEPTFLGWFVALSCYYPFWNKIEGGYFAYNRDNYYWDHWLANDPTWLVIWGSAILVLLLIYMWASVAFGLRFSNLTNRGILTNGPYRFTKHPAYISKNLAWWLIAVPFISQTGAADAIQHSLLLLALNALYFLRARTEEAHLSKDPTYLAYATAMNEKSLLHGLNRFFPFLRYNPSRYSPQ